MCVCVDMGGGGGRTRATSMILLYVSTLCACTVYEPSVCAYVHAYVRMWVCVHVCMCVGLVCGLVNQCESTFARTLHTESTCICQAASETCTFCQTILEKHWHWPSAGFLHFAQLKLAAATEKPM